MPRIYDPPPSGAGDRMTFAACHLRSRAEAALVLALPLALTVALALRSGGFSPAATAAAAAAVLAVLVARTAAVRRPFRYLGAPAATAIGAFSAFAAWSLASSTWSGAASRAVLEYDRTLLYLGCLVLFASMGRDQRTARRLALGLGVAFLAVSLAALGPFLLPSRFPLGDSYPRSRLGWPTSYWNATGLIAAMASLFVAHVTCSPRWPPAARVIAAACVPVGVAVIWFSISRGSVLVLGVGALALVVLARSRGMLTGLPVVAVGAVAAGLVCAQATGLTAQPVDGEGIESGKQVAGLLGLVALVTAVLRVVCLRFDRSLDRVRIPEPSARARRSGVAVALVALIVAFFAVDGSSRLSSAWERFTSPVEVSSKLTPAQRFAQVGNNGRLELYEVALREGVTQHPVRGTGVGTFATLWTKHRASDQSVVDAHSLYLEVLAELGVVGLGLLLLTLTSMVTALARRAWQDGGAWALLAALAVGWCVGAAFDWYWELPAVTVWLFAAGGLALSRPREADDGGGDVSSGRPLPQWARVATVAALLLLATTPVSVFRSQTALTDAIAAFRAGDCTTTARRSLDAAAALNSRPEPFELLTYCDARAGRTVLAAQAARAAVKRDPDNWEFRYVLAMALAAGGNDPRPAAREALARNPRDPRARAAFAAFRDAAPRDWRRLALASATLVPGQP